MKIETNMYRSRHGGPAESSLFEGLAVGALIHHGIALMSADHDAIQGAVVLSVAVMSTGLDGAFDALVCMAVHTHFLLYFGVFDSMPPKSQIMRCIFLWTVLSCYGSKKKER